VNATARHEALSRIYEASGQKEKAIHHCEELLQLNSSNLNYYTQILRVHGFSKPAGSIYTDEEQAKIEEIMAEYQKNLPRATAHQRLLLKVLSGDRFKQRFLAYSKPLIVKGAPALLIDLKADIYSSPEKTKIVEEVLLSHLASMEATSTLSGSPSEEQDPTVYLWLLYFTAQHYYQLRDFERALRYLEQAIAHTPTVVDLYVLKAKIFKRAGNLAKAAKLFDEARKLDLADRYLNAVASRYMIRVD
jgi:peptide alpha-N-acetyltransferase